MAKSADVGGSEKYFAHLLAIHTAPPEQWREFTDDEAFMQLALANAQSGLTPLERGNHALAATTKYGANGKDSLRKYAYRILGVEDGTDAEKSAAQKRCLDRFAHSRFLAS